MTHPLDTVAKCLRPALPWLLITALFALGGCEQATDSPLGPTDPGGPSGDAGDLDPSAGLVELKSVDMVAPDGTLVPITLLGGGLEILADGSTVALDVALRNDGWADVTPPLILWLDDFNPVGVTVLNADLVETDDAATGELLYGFDYSGHLGVNGALAPGETSDARRWEFHVPGLTAFSFGGEADGGFGPSAAVLGGMVFGDLNRNGHFDPDEPPLGGVPVRVVFPDGLDLWTETMADGTYAVDIAEPGLYELRVEMPWTGAYGHPEVTTPNPLYVTILPGPDGRPLDYWDAMFGLAEPDDPHHGDLPPVAFTPLPPHDLQSAFYTLLSAWNENDHVLRFMVGYNGCQPEPPFILYASGDFTPSDGVDPPRATLVLVNELEEACGWIEKDLAFDMTPLFDEYRAVFGPGELVLDILDPSGAVYMSTYFHVD